MKKFAIAMVLAGAVSGSAWAGETQGTNKFFDVLPVLQKLGICATTSKGETQGTNKSLAKGETQGTNKAYFSFSSWNFLGVCNLMTKGETQGTN